MLFTKLFIDFGQTTREQLGHLGGHEKPSSAVLVVVRRRPLGKETVDGRRHAQAAQVSHSQLAETR